MGENIQNGSGMQVSSLFFLFNLFLEAGAGQKSFKKIVGFLVETKTPKGHSKLTDL